MSVSFPLLPFFAFLQHWPRYSARTFGYTINGRGACGWRTSRMQMYGTNACTHAPCHHVEKREVTVFPVRGIRLLILPLSNQSLGQVIVITKQNCGTTRRTIMITIPYHHYFKWCYSFPEHLTISFSPLILHPDGRRTPIQYYSAHACMRARSLKTVALCALRHGTI